MHSSRKFMFVVGAQREAAQGDESEAQKLRGEEETDDVRIAEDMQIQEDKMNESGVRGAGEAQGKPKMSLIQRILGPDPKERLKALGSGALLSYGCVSNFCYISAVHMAYYAGARQTGISPLYDATSRSIFFTVYAGLFALNNVVRPLRVSLSVVLAVRRSSALCVCFRLPQRPTKILPRGATYLSLSLSLTPRAIETMR